MTALEALGMVANHMSQSRNAVPLADLRRQAEQEAEAVDVLDCLAPASGAICALVDHFSPPLKRAARLAKAVALMEVIDEALRHGLDIPTVSAAMSRLSRRDAPPSVSDTDIATAWRRFGEDTVKLLRNNPAAQQAWSDSIWHMRLPRSTMGAGAAAVAALQRKHTQLVLNALTGESAEAESSDEES